MHKDAVNEFFKVKRKRFYSCKHKNQSHQSHTSLVSRAFPYGYTPQGCDFVSVSVFLWLFVCLLVSACLFVSLSLSLSKIFKLYFYQLWMETMHAISLGLGHRKFQN